MVKKQKGEKLESLTSNPMTHIRKLYMARFTCNPNAVESGEYIKNDRTGHPVSPSDPHILLSMCVHMHTVLVSCMSTQTRVISEEGFSIETMPP